MAGVLDNCTVDFECGPGQVCFPQGVRWAPDGVDTDFCYFVQYYWDGEDGSFNATTYFLFVFLGLQAAVGLVFFLVGMWDVASNVVAFRKELKLNATLWTACATTAGLLCHFMWRVLLLASTADVEGFDARATDDADAEKLARYSVPMRPFIFCCILFLVIACLQVSVLWVEIAYRARNMRTRVVSSVTYYRKVVLAFQLLFVCAMVPIAVTGLWSLSVVVGLPFIIAIMGAFFVGRRRMLAVLGTSLSMANSKENVFGDGAAAVRDEEPKASGCCGPTGARGLLSASSFRIGTSGGEKSAADRTRRAMTVIARTALHVIVGCATVVVSGLLYFVLNTPGVGSPDGGRDFMMPGFSPITFVQAFTDFGLLLMLVAIQRYSHRNIRKIVRRKRGGDGKSSGTDGSKDDDNSKTDLSKNTSFVQPYDGGSVATTKPAASPSI